MFFPFVLLIYRAALSPSTSKTAVCVRELSRKNIVVLTDWHLKIHENTVKFYETLSENE